MSNPDFDTRPFNSFGQARDWAFNYFLAHYRKGVANWIFAFALVLLVGFCATVLIAELPSTSPDDCRSYLQAACVMAMLAGLALYCHRRLQRKATDFTLEATSTYGDEPITPASIKQTFKIYVALEQIVRPPQHKR